MHSDVFHVRFQANFASYPDVDTRNINPFVVLSIDRSLLLIQRPILIKHGRQRKLFHKQRRQEPYTTDDSQSSPQHCKTACEGNLDLKSSFWRKRRELWNERVHNSSPLWNGLKERLGKSLAELVLEDYASDGDTPHLQQMSSYLGTQE